MLFIACSYCLYAQRYCYFSTSLTHLEKNLYEAYMDSFFLRFIILAMSMGNFILLYIMNNTVLFSEQVLREISRSHIIFLNNHSFHNRSFRSLHRIPLQYSHNRYNRYSPHHFHKSSLLLKIRNKCFEDFR